MSQAGRKGALFLLLFLFFLLITGSTVRWWGRHFFPLRYWTLVEAHSQGVGLDPLLVMALIREESSFNPNAVSRRGALGLMQIVPETGAWIAAQLGDEAAPSRLFTPAVSIRFGSWYLARLCAEFGGDRVKALAAYNAGGNRVHDWLARGVWDGRLAALGRVPFPETRRYVIKILRSYRIYKFLYGSMRS